jgi:hypothetical protein
MFGITSKLVKFNPQIQINTPAQENHYLVVDYGSTKTLFIFNFLWEEEVILVDRKFRIRNY